MNIPSKNEECVQSSKANNVSLDGPRGANCGNVSAAAQGYQGHHHSYSENVKMTELVLWCQWPFECPLEQTVGMDV